MLLCTVCGTYVIVPLHIIFIIYFFLNSGMENRMFGCESLSTEIILNQFCIRESLQIELYNRMTGLVKINSYLLSAFLH